MFLHINITPNKGNKRFFGVNAKTRTLKENRPVGLIFPSTIMLKVKYATLLYRNLVETITIYIKLKKPYWEVS